MIIIEEKKYLEKLIRYLPDNKDRKWLGGYTISPYSSGNLDKIVIYALEGTPMRGWVVFNYGTQEIHVYGMDGKRVKRFNLITDFIKDL